MFNRTKSTIARFSILLFAAVQVPLYAQDEGALRTPKGDIALELVGQVLNVPATPTSEQYGYLSFVRGIDTVFTSTFHNETTALFTFYTAANTTQVINNGNLRIVDRIGTTTIYFNDAPNGNFAVPNTFASGTPILTMSLKQQVILDLVGNTFTAVNINTVTSRSAFVVYGNKFHFGHVGEQFRTFISGRGNSTGTPAGFVIGGYVVPIAESTQ
ncbi:MAG TPA: hypothetical protein VIE67_07175 [Rudaea sp.]|jgi:hypothetical protein|uniref:hypothetical protein n=1 Tax=Rudaea sp. TaxID=2136325 RepID=UPI002F945F3A